jgi:hypothetical protein
VLLANDTTEYLINSTLAKTQQHIVPAWLKPYFIQINRAEVVNTKFVEELTGETVKTNKHNFEATDGYIKDLKRALHIT